MNLFFPLATTLLMLVCGVHALWLNPKRPTNRTLALYCFFCLPPFIAQLTARYLGYKYSIDHISNPLPWVRLRYSFIALECPFLAWVCYYIVSGRYSSRKNLALKLVPWIIISGFLAVIPWSQAFKPDSSLPDNVQAGPLYHLYFIILTVCEIVICIACVLTQGKLLGIRKLEFKFITLPLGYLGSVCGIFGLLYAFFPKIGFISGTLKVLSFLTYWAFGLSTWSVTSRKIYDSTEVLRPSLLRIALLILIAWPSIKLIHFWNKNEPGYGPAMTILAAACVLFYVFDEQLRIRLRIGEEEKASAVSSDLLNLWKAETNPNKLLEDSEAVLAQSLHCSRVRVFTLDTDRYQRGESVIEKDALVGTALMLEGWSSFESLRRVPDKGAVTVLLETLQREQCELIVVPRFTQNEPSVLLAAGGRASQKPFTYPEIRLLRSIAEQLESLYVRTRLTLQAQQAEQLATIGLIGASLAHELRNPIVSISTFAELLPAKLNDRGFLSEWAAVIPGEAKRIGTLAEQLLNLARPRSYDLAPVDIRETVGNVLVLLAPRARQAGINLGSEIMAEDHRVMGDEQSLRQILINLCINALEAVTQKNERGRVMVRTRNENMRLVIEVEDNGAGIRDDIHKHLFRPFASSGKKNGFGLGLVICAEIVRAHRGILSASNGRESGAVFRVTLPLKNGAT